MDTVRHAIEQLAQGKIIILRDDEQRENEGDFVQAASFVTAQSVNFMISEGRGLLCQTIPKKRADELQLEMQTQHNTSLHSTAFTVSVDYIHGTSTGISASDRAKTIQAVENGETLPTDLARPGHIFPITAHEGGLVSRNGHTEASVELVKQAKVGQSAIICEILNKEGQAASLSELQELASRHDLAIISIEKLIEYLSQ